MSRYAESFVTWADNKHLLHSTFGETTRLFALLVGLNKYRSEASQLEPLRGAVADVEGFQTYLETCLAVPREQISVLTDDKATRHAIISALRGLGEDSRINKGDAILIYYAGHGTEMDPPANWEAGGRGAKIQAIVPYDCTVSAADSGPDLPPITDRLLNVLLANIADKKGDNITVILDCCHSASGTREFGDQHKGYKGIRSVVLTRNFSSYQHHLDEPISHADPGFHWSASPFPHSNFNPTYHGLASHVLLAACAADEKAHEEAGHGRFSAALLKLLNSVPPEKLRYSEILEHSTLGRIVGQNPHVEGLSNLKKRTLFNAKVLPTERKTFRVQSMPQETKKQGGGQHYIVDGGTIHNITSHCKFSVYHQSDIEYSKIIGTLQVVKVDPFTLIAKTSDGSAIDTTAPTIAIRATPAKHHFPHIHIGNGFRDVLHSFSDAHNCLKNLFENIIPLVDDPQNAHTKISMTDNNKVQFTWTIDTTHGLLSRELLTPAVQLVDLYPEKLAHVLSKMAHFYREVKHSNNDAQLSRHIVIEFYKLQTVVESGYGPRLDPVGKNLCIEDTVSITVWPSEEALYGMKIINNSKQDLDVNVYRFNNHDLSISPCAESCTSQSLRPSLPLKHSGGSLAIGYGAAGHPAICFKTNGDLDTEVLFLKLYVSTQAVNLSHLSQTSPFTPTSRGMVPYKPKPKVSWTDIVIPVILNHKQNRGLPWLGRRN